MIVFWIVEALASFVECFVCTLFVGDVLDVQAKNYRINAVLSAIMTAGVIMLNRIQLFSAVTLVYAVMGLTLCTYYLYRESFWDIIVAVVSYFLLLYLSEFLLISVTGFLSKDRGFGLFIISEQSWARVIYVVISKIILISLYIASHKCLQKIIIPSRKILIGVFAALVLIFYVIKRLCEEIENDLIGTGILIVLIVVMGIYLALQYSEMRKQKQQAELTDERNRIMMKGYEDMLRSYRSNSLFYHDLKNHMLTIECYLANDEYDKAADYMRALRMNYIEVDVCRWTGIEIIDFVLNYKKKIAEEKGISFCIDADPVNITEIAETDLCALFGNLLDNAIESCEREKEKTEIRISIRRIQEMLLVKAVNSCKNPPSYQNGILSTVKENKDLHGWGMKSMKAIMEKYGGTMQWSHKNGEFSVVFAFFF